MAASLKQKAAAALTATRTALTAELVATYGREQLEKVVYLSKQVDTGKVLLKLAATFSDAEKTAAKNREDFNAWAKIHLVNVGCYSSMRTYMRAATFAALMPGAEEQVNGNIASLNYLATFEMDHAADILVQAGPNAGLKDLQEAATKVVPSLKPDPKKEEQKKRDAAIRDLDKVTPHLAPFTTAYLKLEGTFTPDLQKIIRPIVIKALTVAGNNGELSVVAVKKLIRAHDDVKKQRDEEAADRAATAAARIK